MKKLTYSTALAGVLALGMYGMAHAQTTSPSQPGTTTTPGSTMGQTGTSQPGTSQSGTSQRQPGGAATPGSTMGQTGTSQPGTSQSGTTQRQPGAATTPGSTMGQTGTTQRQPGATTGQSAQDIRMSEQQIRSMLESRGYSDISGLERDGDNFKVSEAKRYGADVEDLKVDARTGQVQDEKRLTEDQAKNMLRDRGFSDVSDMKRDGDTISAKAKQGDRSVELRIDAQTGTVTQQRAGN